MGLTDPELEVLELVELTGGQVTPDGLMRVTGRSWMSCAHAVRGLLLAGLIRRRAEGRFAVTPAGVRELRMATEPGRKRD